MSKYAINLIDRTEEYHKQKRIINIVINLDSKNELSIYTTIELTLI